MARIKKNGKVNTLSGVIGEVVVVSGEIVRSKPRKRTKKFTPNEKHNQSKFTVVNTFLAHFFSFMKLHFKDLDGRNTARDAIRSYHQLHLTTENNGVVTTHYPKALMSTGRLRGFLDAGVSLEGRDLAVAWQDNSNQAYAAATDLLSVIAYNDNAGEAYFFEDCATRADGEVVLTFPGYFPLAGVHLWATFSDPDLVNCANSDYLGFVEGE